MPGPGVLRGVLGRLADQPGERDERERGEDEERHVAGAGELVDRDRDRREDERCPEELPAHARKPKEPLRGRDEAGSDRAPRRRLARPPLSVKSCGALHPLRQ